MSGKILGPHGDVSLPVRHAAALPLPATGRRPAAMFRGHHGNHEMSAPLQSAGSTERRLLKEKSVLILTEASSVQLLYGHVLSGMSSVTGV